MVRGVGDLKPFNEAVGVFGMNIRDTAAAAPAGKLGDHSVAVADRAEPRAHSGGIGSKLTAFFDKVSSFFQGLGESIRNAFARAPAAEAAPVPQPAAGPPVLPPAVPLEGTGVGLPFATDHGVKPTKTELGPVMSALDTAIQAKIEVSKTDEARQAQGLGSMTRGDVLDDYVRNMGALVVRQIDPDHLSPIAASFTAEGLTEQGTLLADLADLVREARTPDGAHRLFDQLAAEAMTSSKDLNLFLRDTTDTGAAAIKKLMTALGPDYVSAGLDSLEPLMKSPEAIALANKLDAAGVTSLKSHMSDELAKECAQFALKMADALLTVPVPQGMKDTLANLAGQSAKVEVITKGQNGQPDTKTLGDRATDDTNMMARRLYSDQLVLKGVGTSFSNEAATRYGSNPELKNVLQMLKVCGDMINMVGNDVREAGKVGPEARAAYKEVGPQIHLKMNAFFVSAGLPKEALTEWKVQDKTV